MLCPYVGPKCNHIQNFVRIFIAIKKIPVVWSFDLFDTEDSVAGLHRH